MYAVCTCIGVRQCIQRVKRSSEPTTTMTGSHRRRVRVYRCSTTRFNNRNFQTVNFLIYSVFFFPRTLGKFLFIIIFCRRRYTSSTSSHRLSRNTRTSAFGPRPDLSALNGLSFIISDTLAFSPGFLFISFSFFRTNNVENKLTSTYERCARGARSQVETKMTLIPIIYYCMTHVS